MKLFIKLGEVNTPRVFLTCHHCLFLYKSSNYRILPLSPPWPHLGSYLDTAITNTCITFKPLIIGVLLWFQSKTNLYLSISLPHIVIPIILCHSQNICSIHPLSLHCSATPSHSPFFPYPDYMPQSVITIVLPIIILLHKTSTLSSFAFCCPCLEKLQPWSNALSTLFPNLSSWT